MIAMYRGGRRNHALLEGIMIASAFGGTLHCVMPRQLDVTHQTGASE